MKHIRLGYQTLVVLSLLTVISGCRYKSWGESVFYQGCSLDTYQEVACDYLRTLHIYDQFTTLGHFDVLWVSNEVRTIYSKLYAKRHCYEAEKYKVFLRRQLEENNHYITFYVLGNTPHSRGTLLSDEETAWSVCLAINSTTILPCEVKTVELRPEYKHLFGKAYRQFKTPYSITFEAHDIEGRSLVPAGGQSMKLYFNTIGKTACVEWDLSASGSVCGEDEDPGFLAYDLWSQG